MPSISIDLATALPNASLLHITIWFWMLLTSFVALMSLLRLQKLHGFGRSSRN